MHIMMARIDICMSDLIHDRDTREEKDLCSYVARTLRYGCLSD